MPWPEMYLWSKSRYQVCHCFSQFSLTQRKIPLFCIILFLELLPELNLIQQSHLLLREIFKNICLARRPPNNLLPPTVERAAVSPTSRVPLGIAQPTVNPALQGSSGRDLVAQERPGEAVPWQEAAVIPES